MALQFKPIRQSCVCKRPPYILHLFYPTLPIAYVFDLRDRFAGPGRDLGSTENTLVSGEWRERALELEARCLRLERMFDWDKLGTDLYRESREQTAGKYFYRASGRCKYCWARDAGWREKEGQKEG